jgi:hypothetical protein
MNTDVVHDLIRARGLTDIVGGAQRFDAWVETLEEMKHRPEMPDQIVVVMERVGGVYRGALYIPEKNFREDYRNVRNKKATEY